MAYFLFSAFMTIYGILYLVFAFREPPAALRSFFKIPSIFIWFPDETRVKWGRVMVGVLFIVVFFVVTCREVLRSLLS